MPRLLLRPRPGERSARGGVLVHPSSGGDPESPRRLGGTHKCERPRKRPDVTRLCLQLSVGVILSKSLPSPGLGFPVCKTRVLSADARELGGSSWPRAWAGSSPGPASVSLCGGGPDGDRVCAVDSVEARRPEGQFCRAVQRVREEEGILGAVWGLGLEWSPRRQEGLEEGHLWLPATCQPLVRVFHSYL